jgi:hypothetical protein
LGSVNCNCTFLMFFIIITITYPLHVSAPTGHLHVEYIYWLLHKELFFYNGSVVLVLVINCINFSFLFWRFFAAVSMSVVNIIDCCYYYYYYYYYYIFQY